MASDYKPSQVYLGPLPLGATMRRTETELAAAMLVYACVQLGDQWQPVRLRDIGRIITEAIEQRRKPVACWASNPFLLPDMEALWLDGHADLAGEPPEQTVAFTEQGLEAMRRWVRLPAGEEGG